MCDQNYIKGITFTNTSNPDDNNGLKRLESDGTNLYFNGNKLSSNAFNPGISCNIIYTANTQTGSILIDSNLQVGSVMWANTSNITITENLDFNKINPKINYSSGILDLTSDTGETALSIISGTQSNIYLRSADSDNVTGSDKTQLLMLATGDSASSSNKHLLAQISSSQKEVLNASGGGGKLVFKTRRAADAANTDDGSDEQVDMMTIFSSKEVADGNTIAFGGAVDSNVRVCINRGIESGLTFDVGNAAQSYLSVDTSKTNANVNIGENVRLNFNGPINISQTGNNIRLGTTSELPTTADNKGVVWIGRDAGSKGDYFESIGSVAIGWQAGYETDKSAMYTVSIGQQAGMNNRGNYEVAIGHAAGQYRDGVTSSQDAISIGRAAGRCNQQKQCIAIGHKAGGSYQGNNGENALAIGYMAAESYQGESSIAIGYKAGRISQNAYSLAIGAYAGNATQYQDSLAIGYEAGFQLQNTQSLAIGNQAGKTYQNSAAVAIGYQAGKEGQQANCVSIGFQSGESNQGRDSLAIGYKAGQASQHENSIILNATGSALNSTNVSNTYIKPIHCFSPPHGAAGATSNIITVGSYNYGVVYCNVQTGQLCVVGQDPS